MQHIRCSGIKQFFKLFIHSVSVIVIAIDNIGTLKPVLSGHQKIDKTKIIMTNDSLMKIESIAELEHSAILLTYNKR